MEGQEKDYATVEELKAKRNTPDAVFEGTKAANGWKPGKMVTEKEYLQAVEAFMTAPMDGREVKQNVQ